MAGHRTNPSRRDAAGVTRAAEPRPGGDGDDHLAEPGKAGPQHPVVVEVVAVEQQGADGRDAVAEAVHADRGQRVGHRAQLHDVPGAGDQPARHLANRLAAGALTSSGPSALRCEAAAASAEAR